MLPFLVFLLLAEAFDLLPLKAIAKALGLMIRFEVSLRNQVLQQPSYETGCKVFWNCIVKGSITLSVSASV